MSRPRPVVVLEYTGPNNRYAEEYQRALNARTSGQLNPVEYRTVIERLNALERAYRRAGELRRERYRRKAEEKAELARQEQAFLRIVEAQAKKEREAEEKRRALERFNAQVEAERVAREERARKLRESYARRKAKKAQRGFHYVKSVEPFKQSIIHWLKTKGEEGLLFELPHDMLTTVALKDKMTVQFDLMNGDIVKDSFSCIIEKQMRDGKEQYVCDGIWSHYNWSSVVKGLHQYKDVKFIKPDSMASTIMSSTTLRMSGYAPIQPKKKPQAFREGLDHCVFQPIITFLESAKEEAKTDKTKWNYQTKINKALSFAKKYDGGIPEEDLDEVAKALDVGIAVHSLSTHELYQFNHRFGKVKIFHFINTRMNHVEMLTMDLNSDAELITKEEGLEILHHCMKNRLYNYYDGTITSPHRIITADKKYLVGEKHSTTLFDFTKTFDKGIMIDYIREKELGDFLLSGVHLMINYKNAKCKGSPVAEIDMKKAYTQFKRCSVYQGFPSIINNVRDCVPEHDVVVHCGMYQVQIKEMKKTLMNAKKMDLAHSYGFTVGGYYVLASPWIVKLREIGCVVDVLYGAWGKRMDYEFSQEMMDEKLYAIWTGLQLRRDTDLHYKMACDPEFAEVVMAQHEVENIQYNQATQTIMIDKKKDHHYIMPHVGAFNVAYCQIQVFDEASKYPLAEIVGHKLDSIVLTREPLPFDETLWEDSSSEGIAMSKYTSSYIFQEKQMDLTRGKATPYLGDCFLSGQGGSGKTQTVMGDKGFRGKHFVSTSWELVADKMVEFRSRGGSVNQLLGFDIYGKKIQSHRDKFGMPPVIVYDEVSMSNTDLIRRIREMYPYSQLILMGDYDKGKYYQSSVLMAGKELYHPPTYHMIREDYRSVDEETRSFKRHVRELMDRGESLVRYLHSVIPVSDVRSEYSMDYVMTGTHERIKHFTEMLTSDVNWYKVIKHSMDDVLKKCSGKEAYLHGEVLTVPIEGRTQITHAFTVHSFQGKTIPLEKKCFVDLCHLRTNQDIYTAVSRVRSIHQLRLVKSNYSSVMFSNGVYSYQ